MGRRNTDFTLKLVANKENSGEMAKPVFRGNVIPVPGQKKIRRLRRVDQDEPDTTSKLEKERIMRFNRN